MSAGANLFTSLSSSPIQSVSELGKGVVLTCCLYSTKHNGHLISLRASRCTIKQRVNHNNKPGLHHHQKGFWFWLGHSQPCKIFIPEYWKSPKRIILRPKSCKGSLCYFCTTESDPKHKDWHWFSLRPRPWTPPQLIQIHSTLHSWPRSVWCTPINSNFTCIKLRPFITLRLLFLIKHLLSSHMQEGLSWWLKLTEISVQTLSRT